MKQAFVIFFLLGSVSAAAQKFTIGGESGYGLYKMSDMKDFQKSYSINGFKPTIVQNYPGFIFYRARLSYRISEDWSVGIAYGFMSSGARSDYQDFSGELRVDQKTKANSIGATATYTVVMGRIRFNNLFSFWRSYTTLNVDEYLRLNDTMPQTNTTELKAQSFQFGYTLQGGYVWRHLHAGIFVGYDYDLKGKLKFEGAETTLKTDWSGLRTGVFASLTF